MYETYLLMSIFTPFLGSVIIGILGGALRNIWAVLITVSSLFFTCLLIPVLGKGETIETVIPFFSSELFALSFIGDGIGVIFAFIFSLLGSVAVIYSLEYMKKYSNQLEYYFMTTLMIGSLMGLAYSRNLVLMYIFWEIASLTTWRLVGFHRGKEETAIANKTFLMIFGGSSFMLLGFIMIYSNTQTFDLISLKSYPVSNLALFLILIGIITKAAVLPVHNWLPDAHTVSPSPTSALLSGIVVKIGLLAFLRIFCITFNTSWNWILILAVMSSIVAASTALLQTDIKKIIAYSTVSQVGYMLLGFTVLSKTGFVAGLLYFMVHAVSKAGLFLCAGIIEQKCGERNISKLGGLMKVLPVTGTAFTLCALSIIGIPPFGGFFSKIMVIMAIIKEENYLIAALAILTAVLTLLYLFRLFSAVFLGELKFSGVKEQSRVMVACALLLGIISLVSGLFINQISGIIDIAGMHVFQ